MELATRAPGPTPAPTELKPLNPQPGDGPETDRAAGIVPAGFQTSDHSADKMPAACWFCLGSCSQPQSRLIHNQQKQPFSGGFSASLDGEERLSNFLEENPCHHYMWCYGAPRPTT